MFTRAGLRLGPSLLCVAAGATAYHLTASDYHLTAAAQCEMPTAPSPPPVPPTAVTITKLRRCLEQRGADIAAIDIRASEKDKGRFGVFAGAGVRHKAARSWWGSLKAGLGFGENPNVALASFPLSSAVTAGNVLGQGGQQAALLKELVELGVADERTVVMLHLIVERLKGPESKLCPWLVLLPKSFSTTLFFSEQELGWLKGTTLHTATRVRKQLLEAQWRRLEPACRQLALAEGVEQAPTYQDFLWAYSTFWPREGGKVETEEGIVPGLDFANHAEGSPARWTVFGAADRPSKATPTCVTLVCPRKQLPKQGEEITINYGNKGNEELLFLYGFAEQDNPNDVLMVRCPISPPDEWDAKMQARMRLLMLRQLKPQIFLPAPFLRGQQQQQQGSSSRRRRWWWPFGRRGSTAGKAGTADSSAVHADLPQEVFETLELFVMEPRQLQQELARLEQGGTAKGVAAQQALDELSPVERSGLRMAVLTTLVRLLEYTVVQQEGDEGTGTLEADQALLKAAGEGNKELSVAERHALHYRMGQKQLARDYLVYARGLLEKEMRHLRALMGPEDNATS
ncbi:hypothetical protein N2152v2_003996 [Parachlorella kessleri]